jgi:hypothetical protein
LRLRGWSAHIRVGGTRRVDLVASILVIEIHGRARLGDGAGRCVDRAILAAAAATAATAATRAHFVTTGLVCRFAFAVRRDCSGDRRLLLASRLRRVAWSRRCRSIHHWTWCGCGALLGAQLLLADGGLFATVARTAFVATVATPRLLLTLTALLAGLAAWTAITTTVTLALRLRIAFRARALRLTTTIRCCAGTCRRRWTCRLRSALIG